MAKNVIIMGATSGIGASLAGLFAALGCHLAIAGRRAPLLEQSAARLQAAGGERVIWEPVDVCSEGAAAAIERLAAQLGGVDLYIHASGIGCENPQLDPGIELETTATNTLGFARCLDAAFRLMEAQGGNGQIAAISSVAGTRGIGISPAYSASKAFQSRYLEALRQRASAKGLGLFVTDIRPGFIDTPFLAGKHYPMTLKTEHAASLIKQAILAKRRVAWIDWRYMLLGWIWSAMPGMLWEQIPVGFVPFETPKSGKGFPFSGFKRKTGRASPVGSALEAAGEENPEQPQASSARTDKDSGQA